MLYNLGTFGVCQQQTWTLSTGDVYEANSGERIYRFEAGGISADKSPKKDIFLPDLTKKDTFLPKKDSLLEFHYFKTKGVKNAKTLYVNDATTEKCSPIWEKKGARWSKKKIKKKKWINK